MNKKYKVVCCEFPNSHCFAIGTIVFRKSPDYKSFTQGVYVNSEGLEQTLADSEIEEIKE